MILTALLCFTKLFPCEPNYKTNHWTIVHERRHCNDLFYFLHEKSCG